MTLFKFDEFVFTDDFDPEYPGYTKKNGRYAPLHIYNYWKNTGVVSVKGKTAIHHIDGDRENNEFNNLELINLSKHIKIHKPTNKKQSLESRERISKSQSGKGLFKLKGVSIDKRVKGGNKAFRSTITFNGHQKSLGYFIEPITCNILYNITQEEIYKGV